ncbi:MAG TPA: enolase C-terminal domain-like protein [Gemmatimonadaceae bacterium]|nr:enolase C-terminal domain-like protein [Gemmatimonadaceae bacterium]
MDEPRWKYVGRNAYKERHGYMARDLVLILDTNTGAQGIGPSRASQEDAHRLLGRDPLAFLLEGQGVRSPLHRFDAPIWDLIGKLLARPVWQILGGHGPEWVPVYDGSLYFSDLEPEYAGRGVERILVEVDHALERGHRAFKLKIGRGFKWMEREEGFRRDVQVVRGVRQHLEPAMKLMVDANNGYDLEGAKRFLDEAGVELFFVEEMFEERVRPVLEFKEWLRSRGWRTLIADGETVADPARYRPFIRSRAIDVLQGNVLVFGFQRLLDLSRITAPEGIMLAPNNWDSMLGHYMQLALGRGIPNLLTAEEDPGESPLFDVSAFELREGRRRVPDMPGCGWALRTELLEATSRPRWTLST